MNSQAGMTASAPAKRPLRALEPSHPLQRAVLAGLPRRRWSGPGRVHLRTAQRLAAGMSPAEVARAEGKAEADIQALLAHDRFLSLVESQRALAERPVEEQTLRLVRLARIAIENALGEWDVGAACFVLREHAQGRDPALTLTQRVLASAARAAAPVPGVVSPPGPAAGPPRPRDPLDALVHRRTAALRHAVLDEAAVRHAATAPEPAAASGASATRAAAERALALKAAAVPATPPAHPPGRPASRAAPSVPRAASAMPAASTSRGSPRRPRAP